MKNKLDKSIIRKNMLNKRKSILDKEKLSTIIVNKILSYEVYKKAKVIALYKSMKNEVNTSNLINNSFNKTVLLPRIINNNLSFIKINNDTSYTKSNIGVLEPIGDIYNGKIDLIIVPGVAFDEKLNRLGYGMGYYDNYLKDKNIYKIGICFDEQLINELPTNELDIKVDMIITEKIVIKKV